MRAKVPQKIVAIKGAAGKVLFRNAQRVQVVDASALIEVTASEKMDEGVELHYVGHCKGRGTIKVLVDGQTYKLQIVVFGDREFFLALVISSNNHLGQDPENCIRGCEHESLHNVTGHGFFKTCRTLEPIYHSYDLPITWLIDEVVAKDGNQRLRDFHERYGDDYGLMPSSFFHHNSQNYNLEKSQEEVNRIVGDALRKLEDQFDSYTSILGIDQWIGSVGSKFVKAAEYLGLKGIWGLGYDHYTCDTSMFHRGCPWDMYKPDRENIKLPATYPTDLWAFQWTTRDVINTVHTPDGVSSGSVMFATDPDDISASGIMEHQKDYYAKLLRSYRDSMGRSDFSVYLMHQEDHETHKEHDNVYLNAFLDQIKEDEGITFATLNEIEQWLNIKYGAKEHPTQMLVVEDILSCKENIVWKRVRKPDDWRTFNTHCLVYNRDVQVIFERPYHRPYRVFDYKMNHPIDEMDSYPEEALEEVLVQKYHFSQYQCHLEITSEKAYEGYYLALWDIPDDLPERLEKDVMISGGCMVLRIDLAAGKNHVEILL